METENELLNQARRLNKEALIKVFDLYSVPLYRYALRLCQDPITADQIVGDVFAKLLDQLPSGNGSRTNLRPHHYEIAYHRVVDEARTSHRKASLEEVEWPGYGVNASSTCLEDQVLVKQVLHAIQNDLTDDQRHVIILRFLEGFSLKETAAILRKKVGKVKVIQNRAVSVLRQALPDKRCSKVNLPTIIDKSTKTRALEINNKHQTPGYIDNP
jgi:RNA polymerase sigma-70 factor (ECF subfamily)